MAKNSIRDYDNTSGNNTDVQSVDISEGCSPAGINNAIREVMADLADVNDGTVALESPQADSLTVTGDLTVDTSTLYVDSTNDRVGIGTTSLIKPLTIAVGDTSTISGVALNHGASNYWGFGSYTDQSFRIAKSHGLEDANTYFTINRSNGNVGIGTSSPSSYDSRGNNLVVGDSGDAGITIFSGSTSNARLQFAPSGATGLDNGLIDYDNNNDKMSFATAGTDRLVIDSSGSVFIGNKTGLSDAGAGHAFAGSTGHGLFYHTRDGGLVGSIKRETSDGDILRFVGPSAQVGFIGTISDGLYIGSPQGIDTYIRFRAGTVSPVTSAGSDRDNALDLGQSSARWDDIYATNGTIQTSDQNEKQQIASLTDAEITAAKAISKLFKTFKWNDKVEAKGDAARTHTGVIAQEVQSAMTDAGLDATKYAFWCSDTWWETQTEVPAVEAVEAQDAVYDEDGNIVTEAVEAVEAQDAYTRTDTYETSDEAPEGATERTRLGIRYPELLAFVGAATEQRLADIETRLTALEAN